MKGKGKKPNSKTKSWKYTAPKSRLANLTQRWSRTQMGSRRSVICTATLPVIAGPDPPIAKNMKLQGSLKSFLVQSTGGKAKLSKKERKQLQALLSTMSHDEDSKTNG